MTDASIGYKSQFWLWNPTAGALAKLAEVRRIQMPAENLEQEEATHLESPGRRREYVDTFFEDTDYEVEMNRIPGSPTELLILSLIGSNEEYAARIVEFDGDVQVATHDFDVRNIRYTPSDIEPDQVKMATMTYKPASDVASTYP